MNTLSARLLHFALPIDAGDRVAVIGRGGDGVMESLEKAKVEVVKAGLDEEPPLAPIDYAIVPAMSAGSAGALCPKLSRWVRPGGGVLVLVSNAEHMSRDLLPKRSEWSGWTQAEGRQALGRNGFNGIEVYGIPNKIGSPRTLVPLNHPAALDWYAGSNYQPISLKGRLAIRLIEKLPHAWQRRILFPTLAFVAQRAPMTEVTPC